MAKSDDTWAWLAVGAELIEPGVSSCRYIKHWPECRTCLIPAIHLDASNWPANTDIGPFTRFLPLLRGLCMNVYIACPLE